ncbi:MAG: peptidoglycan DD-metalloendopeptidase family protein [Alphaproteobacteria bacterium]|nr:peptidoglycan DD-metalloendopeptidase family protein [Alphaproteobacteria bacterium]
MPAGQVATQPTTADQYKHLKGDLNKSKPIVDAARQHTEQLKAQARALQRKLVATAQRVQNLETEKLRLDAEIARLAKEDKRLSAGFERDRIQVARLLALIERLQHDTPPALALKPDDALGAARGAMLLGASLPNVYGKAAELARRITALKETRTQLIARRADGVRNAGELRQARVELGQLLAIKNLEAANADATYAVLRTRLDAIAGQAASLEALLTKVAALRNRPAEQNVVTITAENSGNGERRGQLLAPVVGTIGPEQGAGPGVTYHAAAGAQVVAPADCEVLFAGPYHKNGQVLILEVTAGYDLVLAGLDKVVVRPGDLVLAGEPVGAMPQMGQDGELYFELRQGGRAASPAPLLGPGLRKAKRS